MYDIIHSPLLYYGGKRWLVNDVLDIVPEGTEKILSPFMGGGALELNLACRGYKLICYDLHEPLVNFWQHFLIDSKNVILNSESKLLLMERDDLLASDVSELISHPTYNSACWYYVFNHLCFNGMPDVAGSYMRDYCLRADNVLVFVEPKNRHVFPNKDMWKHLSKLDISVECLNFQDSLEKHKDIFTYLDPPYPGNDRMYMDGKSKFEHDILCDILHKREQWVLSYSDDQLIRDMYSGFSKIVVTRRTKHPKNELLIMSHDVYETLESRQTQMSLF